MTDTPDRSELPLPDFDHLPVGALQSRIHALDASGVSQLLAYERAHGDRLPVKLILERRLEALEGGSQPTGSLPRHMPEISQGHGGSPVTPQTSGPPINPPSQGDPTNPAQPR